MISIRRLQEQSGKFCFAVDCQVTSSKTAHATYTTRTRKFRCDFRGFDDIDARGKALRFARSTDTFSAFRGFLFNEFEAAGAGPDAGKRKQRHYVSVRQNDQLGLRFIVAMCRCDGGGTKAMSFKVDSGLGNDEEAVKRATLFLRSCASERWKKNLPVAPLAREQSSTGHLRERALKHECAYVELDQGEKVDCVCGKNRSRGLMMACERCGAWEHAECQNFRNGRQIPADYICSACKRAEKEEVIVLKLLEQGEDWDYAIQEVQTDGKGLELERDEQYCCSICACEDNEDFQALVQSCSCEGPSFFVHPACMEAARCAAGSSPLPRDSSCGLKLGLNGLCQVCGGVGADSPIASNMRARDDGVRGGRRGQREGHVGRGIKRLRSAAQNGGLREMRSSPREKLRAVKDEAEESEQSSGDGHREIPKVVLKVLRASKLEIKEEGAERGRSNGLEDDALARPEQAAQEGTPRAEPSLPVLGRRYSDAAATTVPIKKRRLQLMDRAPSAAAAPSHPVPHPSPSHQILHSVSGPASRDPLNNDAQGTASPAPPDHGDTEMRDIAAGGERKAKDLGERTRSLLDVAELAAAEFERMEQQRGEPGHAAVGSATTARSQGGLAGGLENGGGDHDAEEGQLVDVVDVASVRASPGAGPGPGSGAEGEGQGGWGAIAADSTGKQTFTDAASDSAAAVAAQSQQRRSPRAGLEREAAGLRDGGRPGGFLFDLNSEFDGGHEEAAHGQGLARSWQAPDVNMDANHDSGLPNHAHSRSPAPNAEEEEGGVRAQGGLDESREEEDSIREDSESGRVRVSSSPVITATADDDVMVSDGLERQAGDSQSQDDCSKDEEEEEGVRSDMGSRAAFKAESSIEHLAGCPEEDSTAHVAHDGASVGQGHASQDGELGVEQEQEREAEQQLRQRPESRGTSLSTVAEDEGVQGEGAVEVLSPGPGEAEGDEPQQQQQQQREGDRDYMLSQAERTTHAVPEAVRFADISAQLQQQQQQHEGQGLEEPLVVHEADRREDSLGSIEGADAPGPRPSLAPSGFGLDERPETAAEVEAAAGEGAGAGWADGEGAEEIGAEGKSLGEREEAKRGLERGSSGAAVVVGDEAAAAADARGSLEQALLGEEEEQEVYLAEVEEEEELETEKVDYDFSDEADEDGEGADVEEGPESSSIQNGGDPKGGEGVNEPREDREEEEEERKRHRRREAEDGGEAARDERTSAADELKAEGESVARENTWPSRRGLAEGSQADVKDKRRQAQARGEETKRHSSGEQDAGVSREPRLVVKGKGDERVGARTGGTASEEIPKGGEERSKRARVEGERGEAEQGHHGYGGQAKGEERHGRKPKEGREREEAGRGASKFSGPSLRTKSTGWDKLPEGFDKAEDALRAAKEGKIRFSRPDSLGGGGGGATTPRDEGPSASPRGSIQARLGRGAPARGRFELSPREDRNRSRRFEEPSMNLHMLSSREVHARGSHGRSRSGPPPPMDDRAGGGDMWLDGMPPGGPYRGMSPPHGRFNDGPGPGLGPGLGPGGMLPGNAAAMAAAKVESSGFLVAPDGTITKRGPPMRDGPAPFMGVGGQGARGGGPPFGIGRGPAGLGMELDMMRGMGMGMGRGGGMGLGPGMGMGMGMGMGPGPGGAGGMEMGQGGRLGMNEPFVVRPFMRELVPRSRLAGRLGEPGGGGEGLHRPPPGWGGRQGRSRSPPPPALHRRPRVTTSPPPPVVVRSRSRSRTRSRSPHGGAGGRSHCSHSSGSGGGASRRRGYRLSPEGRSKHDALHAGRSSRDAEISPRKVVPPPPKLPLPPPPARSQRSPPGRRLRELDSRDAEKELEQEHERDRMRRKECENATADEREEKSMQPKDERERERELEKDGEREKEAGEKRKEKERSRERERLAGPGRLGGRRLSPHVVLGSALMDERDRLLIAHLRGTSPPLRRSLSKGKDVSPSRRSDGGRSKEDMSAKLDELPKVSDSRMEDTHRRVEERGGARHERSSQRDPDALSFRRR
eukprot:jgi/Mesen1/8137/ME000437S07229